MTDFLSGFEGVKGNKDGVITWGEFLDYYSDLSMSVTDDNYFVGMMESVWLITEDEEASVVKVQIEYLTNLLRQKLRDCSKQNSDEYVLRGIFKEFDTNSNGTLTIDELTQLLAKV